MMKLNIKEITIPKIKFTFKKDTHLSEKVLINGKIVVFVLCSLISSFINLIFIGNLTKTSYTLGTLLSVPAAVFLSVLSIGLDASKLIHVIQVNSLKELYRKLSIYPWSKNIKKLTYKWEGIYILYVILSIITSVSLSTISIGAGITKNANTLKQIDEFIIQGEKFSNIDSTVNNITIKSLVDKASDNSESEAILFARQEMNKIWPAIEEYKLDRDSFEGAGLIVSSNKEIEWNGKKIIPSQYWDAKNREINRLLQNAGYGTVPGVQIKNLNRSLIEERIRNNKFNLSITKSNDKAVNSLNELSQSTEKEAFGWIDTLNIIGLYDTKGNKVTFDSSQEKGYKVLVSSALSKLKALRVEIENDSGDIGSSSKIFMQVGGWIDGTVANNNTNLSTALESKYTTSFGSTEILMMLMLLFLSLLCELAINQFSPTIKISRKMLAQFRQHFPPEFNVNKFMEDLNKELIEYDLISEEEFQKQNKYNKINNDEQKIEQPIISKMKSNKPKKKVKRAENNTKIKIDNLINKIDKDIINYKNSIEEI